MNNFLIPKIIWLAYPLSIAPPLVKRTRQSLLYLLILDILLVWMGANYFHDRLSCCKILRLAHNYDEKLSFHCFHWFLSGLSESLPAWRLVCHTLYCIQFYKNTNSTEITIYFDTSTTLMVLGLLYSFVHLAIFHCTVDVNKSMDVGTVQNETKRNENLLIYCEAVITWHITMTISHSIWYIYILISLLTVGIIFIKTKYTSEKILKKQLPETKYGRVSYHLIYKIAL